VEKKIIKIFHKAEVKENRNLKVMRHRKEKIQLKFTAFMRKNSEQWK
jgi:hypothetical protein